MALASIPGMGSRRSNLSGPARPGPVAQPQRDGAERGGQQGGRGGDREGPRASWISADTLYDPWHSAMEVQIMAEFYRSGFGIKLAPVYAGKQGDQALAQGDRRYNHDDSLTVLLNLGDTVGFLAQLDAFMDGRLSDAVIERPSARGPAKRIVLAPASAYYGADHPDFALHEGGLVVSLEQDPGDGAADGKFVVFVSRPKTLQVADGEDEGSVVAFYPELQALRAVASSYVANCARLDFASVRLLDRPSGERREAGASAAQPRRTGLAGAAPPPSGGPARGIAPPSSAPARQPAATRGDVADADIEGALGGGSPADQPAGTDPDLEEALAGGGERQF